MAVSVTGPRAVNELGGPVIPASISPGEPGLKLSYILDISLQSKNNRT